MKQTKGPCDDDKTNGNEDSLLIGSSQKARHAKEDRGKISAADGASFAMQRWLAEAPKEEHFHGLGSGKSRKED